MLSASLMKLKSPVVMTEDARLAVGKLLQLKGEEENGCMLLRSVYLLSKTDSVRESKNAPFPLKGRGARGMGQSLQSQSLQLSLSE